MIIDFKDKTQGSYIRVNYEELLKKVEFEKNYFVLAKTLNGSKSLLVRGDEITKAIDNCFSDENKLVVSAQL